MTNAGFNIPVVETDRVILREHRLSDFEPIAQHWLHDRTRYSGGPLDRKAAWKAFSTDCAQWHLRGYGMWIVEDKATSATAGWIGFYEPDHREETELGWVLLEDFEGKGLAENAVRAARSFGAENWSILTPCSYIDVRNDRSITLAERLGAIREDTREYDGDCMIHVYRHPAPEALS